MKILKLLLVILLTSCVSQKEVLFGSRDNNVCKRLQGKVVFYAIFVDSRHIGPWSAFDITSTLDSISKSMNWIMENAKQDSIPLEILIDYHISPQGTIPIVSNFQRKTLSATLFRMPIHSGIKDVYKWADKTAAIAGKSFPADTSSIITTKNTINNRERLIAKLRDIHKTDNVALVYFINNYYQNEASVAFDTQSSSQVEFAIVSQKSPSIIAHEFLHLFGAWDLYITPFDDKRKQRKKKKLAMQYFPNEIMAFAYRNIENLEISDFTKYLIGWKHELSAEHSKIFMSRKFKPVKY